MFPSFDLLHRYVIFFRNIYQQLLLVLIFQYGKDFGEEKQSTLYFKADILHEFLGDQDISLKDKTSDSNWETVSYDNQGTWYDIGLGFATMMSKNSYAFVDLEKSFGNDNDETYQINAGVQWTF